MKVYIGPFTSWLGPYQLAEKILFWMDKHKDKRVHKFGEWLAGYKDDGDGNDIGKESKLSKFLTWLDKFKKRKIKIHIDKYDTWNMDGTLAMIILPMLKQLKETKHGSHIVDLEDVPEHLRATTTESYDGQLTFDFYEEHEIKEGDCDIHARWDWVLDEMIWAFEQLQPDFDWQDQYRTGEMDVKWKKSDKTFPDPITGEESFTYEMVSGPNDTYRLDIKGIEKHQDRINNGLKLFGKYYQGLWD